MNIEITLEDNGDILNRLFADLAFHLFDGKFLLTVNLENMGRMKTDRRWLKDLEEQNKDITLKRHFNEAYT